MSNDKARRFESQDEDLVLPDEPAPPVRGKRRIQRTASGLVVHVVVPGYTQGAKARSVPDKSALCGANIFTNKAGEVVDVEPPLHDPSRWCPKCLGIEAARRGSLDTLAQLVGLG